MKPRFFCIFDSMCSEPGVATPGMRLHMGGRGGGNGLTVTAEVSFFM